MVLIRKFVSEHGPENFLGKSSKEVFDEYVAWAGEYAVSNFRSFAKSFPRLANVKGVSVCKDGVVRSVYAARDVDPGLIEFVGERDRYMFMGEETGKLWEMYMLAGGECGKIEFSRRMCAMFNLTTETKYINGKYVRVFAEK